ncbi:unnamed protein product [Phyllotreta striolata]|uniref:Uncharacterized protein n=1 Tax=Phyllotreta striolata TaxID=444603 RepID=A0A9N9TX53_PHYSR|nr:unnamed protein product [Phyllotreta striolata]
MRRVMNQLTAFEKKVSDFENKYKNQKNKLIENWTSIKRKLLILIDQKGSKDDRFRNEDINVAYNFPLLFQSSSIRNKKSKIFRYTKIETRDTFITHIETLAEVDELKRKYIERAQQLSTTVQPFIIVCGKDADINVYIAMNNTLYDLGNIVSAIDAAFKIHFALNLEFNVACAPIWTWLQTCVYGIQTEFDKQFGSVEVFKAEFNKVVLSNSF